MEEVFRQRLSSSIEEEEMDEGQNGRGGGRWWVGVVGKEKSLAMMLIGGNGMGWDWIRPERADWPRRFSEGRSPESKVGAARHPSNLAQRGIDSGEMSSPNQFCMWKV
jgi:hypothetical protein